MAVTKITFVTKPKQLPKLASGPIHIVLRPNLITIIKKKEIKMKKSEHLKYCKKIAEVLGGERLHNLDKLQRQSLNNQLNDLIEAHDYVVETVTDEEIIGRYKLVTEYIYPSDFIIMRDMINNE